MNPPDLRDKCVACGDGVPQYDNKFASDKDKLCGDCYFEFFDERSIRGRKKRRICGCRGFDSYDPATHGETYHDADGCRICKTCGGNTSIGNK